VDGLAAHARARPLLAVEAPTVRVDAQQQSIGSELNAYCTSAAVRA
jgi:hypothetical protein